MGCCRSCILCRKKVIVKSCRKLVLVFLTCISLQKTIAQKLWLKADGLLLKLHCVQAGTRHAYNLAIFNSNVLLT